MFPQLCQAKKQTNLVRHKGKRKKTKERKGEEKANLFENHFRSGGEENERRMANNVMQGMRVYDGYLVCLDLA